MNSERHISTGEVIPRLCGSDPVASRPHVMMVLAHPDDETVGAAALLPLLTEGSFVYVTDGAPRDLRDAEAAGCRTREAYAVRRRGELYSGLESVGVPASAIEFLGHGDQEASVELARLSWRMEILLGEHVPDLVLTHPYEGGHPDHDATAFAVHSAVQRIRTRGGPVPVLGEFTSYHLREDRWEFGVFLPAPGNEVLTVHLTDEERRLKRRLMGCHESQQEVLRSIPIETERFRVAPDYDFSAPPHAGELLYERYRWGMTGAHWRETARAALAELEQTQRFGGWLPVTALN